MLMGTYTHREVYRMNISHKATAQSLFFTIKVNMDLFQK